MNTEQREAWKVRSQELWESRECPEWTLEALGGGVLGLLDPSGGVKILDPLPEGWADMVGVPTCPTCIQYLLGVGVLIRKTA